MTNRVDVIAHHQSRQNRMLLLLAAATMAGLAAFSAHAEQDEHYKHPQEAHREEHRQVVRHDEHRYDGYYRQPNVYYTAPPVIYPPAGYYQQPGVSLNFNIPLIR